jgi:hypothetical protein
VLVDAPCSGSGTWRRAPHLKWVTTEAQIDRGRRHASSRCSERFRRLVRPGGRLLYATCSLSRRENRGRGGGLSRRAPSSARSRPSTPFGGDFDGGGVGLTAAAFATTRRLLRRRPAARVNSLAATRPPNHPPTVVPDADYRIKLQVFEGPLDLLLFLIRKNELDIYDIPIESVTRQYIDALHAMQQLDLDVAGSFSSWRPR